MSKKRLCFRTPRYAWYTLDPRLYCVIKSTRMKEHVEWHEYNNHTKKWRFIAYATPEQSVRWLSKDHYRVTELPYDVPSYPQKEN